MSLLRQFAYLIFMFPWVQVWANESHLSVLGEFQRPHKRGATTRTAYLVLFIIFGNQNSFAVLTSSFSVCILLKI